MIIWSGWGILFVPIVALCNVLIIFIWHDLFNLEDSHPLIKNFAFVISFLCSGVITWYVGKALNRSPKEQVYIHKESGEEVKFRPRHSFFFIRLEYWGFILPVVGIIIYVSSFIN